MNLLISLLLAFLPIFNSESSYSFARESPSSIELTPDNSIVLKGEINKFSSHQFIMDLYSLKNPKKIYLFLDTNGGSLEHGSKIVNEIQKHNISCIAEKAYSMGFVLLQACKERYITQYGKIMQHQISYGIQGEKAKIDNYVDFVNQMENALIDLQVNKIGISKKEFKKRTYNDWWLFGKNAIENNCADRITEVTCRKDLIKSNYTINQNYNQIVYSRCPLIPEPLEIKSNKKIDFIFF